MIIEYFKTTLRNYLHEKKITLNTLAKQAGLPEDTLRSVVYGNTKDIKLSTILKIADVLDCSLDELVNRHYYSDTERNLFKRIHNLSEPSFRMISLMVDFEEKASFCKSNEGKHLISVFTLNGNMKDGMFYDCNRFEEHDISKYPGVLIKAIDFGLKISSDHFIPAYYPNDILLLSCKNLPEYNDVVLYMDTNKRIYIRKYTEHGLLPINNFGKKISVDDQKDYTPLGVVLRVDKKFDLEQFR